METDLQTITNPRGAHLWRPAADSPAARQWDLKDRLPHVWEAMFGRFGRFTEIQLRAIPPLLAGKNCVLTAATASGKTEAALAPLLERHKQQGLPKNRLSILYIVPTRALTRDLARRLAQPLDKLALRMQIKTGDEPALTTNRPPALLLTTPESLDSMLANRPRMLMHVHAVVLDELHILDNTPRGDQLRILLNRLRRLKQYARQRGDIADETIQYCAMSATVDDPLQVAARYFNDAQWIHVPGQREIDAEFLRIEGPDTLRELFAGMKQRGQRKAIVFCNSRAECEEWAEQLRGDSPFGARLYVHHASLSADVRHAVETGFAQSEAAVCFATSTLELGIDIGDVDLVTLLGAPNDTAAFLQRIGRGGRRTSRTSVICGWRNDREHALFRVFLRQAISGHAEIPQAALPIPHSSYFFRPSVVAQQLFSYVRQTRLGEIEPDTAYQLFVTPRGEALLPRARFDAILDHLQTQKYFEPSHSGRGHALRPGPAWSELYEQRAIYTNLSETARKPIPVLDEQTGRQIGVLTRIVTPGAVFLFAGRARQAVRFARGCLIVRALDHGADRAATGLRAAWRPMTPELARALGHEMGAPRAAIASDMALLLETEPGDHDEDDEGEDDDHDDDGQDGAGGAWLFHCAGEAWGFVLGELLSAQFGVRVVDDNELYLSIRGTLPLAPLEITAEQTEACLRRRWLRMESWYDQGRFQCLLPPEARCDSVIRAFQVERFLPWFAGRGIAPAVSATTSCPASA
ncbi:MAG: DEAD/DEAH box helicase [Blastocatellia bacterium]